jgi:arylsulfatase A-like enzyme
MGLLQMLKHPVTLVAGAAFVALTSLTGLGCGGHAERPNVVLVVVDSLRADAVGCVAGEAPAAPAIEGLAAEGVCFERAVAPASWNLPSVSSLVTSTPPWVHGQGAPATSAAELTTLAETFAEAGYRTAAFTEMAWPLLQRGFGTFQNTAFKDIYGDPESNSASRTVEAALEWARQNDPKPFFLLVHTYEVHSYFLGKPRHHELAQAEVPTYDGPFREWGVRDLSRPAGPQVIEALLPATEDDLTYVRALYRGGVAEADAAIATFVTGLQEAGLDDQTVLALTSSNGEGFRPDLKRLHHGGRLHHDLLHVPLIVRWPGHLEPAVEGALVATLDLAPTLVKLAGLPEEPLFSGRPLVTAETGLLSSLRGPLFRVARLPKGQVVAQEAAFRISPTGEREAATSAQLALYSDWVILIDRGDGAELYDLKDDPEQENDLAADYADGVARLQKKVRQIAARTGPDLAAPDAEQLEQLRSLGYVQ